MDRVSAWRQLFVFLGMTLLSPVWALDYRPLSPVLSQLLEFHPNWVTKTHSSHDPTGANGDGGWYGHPVERIEGQEYKVLFHDYGEGRISRIWMTSTMDRPYPKDYEEIWILIDGLTVYKGNPIDFFSGRGPWKWPLVLDRRASSGAFTSYVPFPYSNEIKILFKGIPNYFQVTYREGAGASMGPSAQELTQFMNAPWWSENPIALKNGEVAAGEKLVLAQGPMTISKLEVRLEHEDLGKFQIKVSDQSAVPLAFFFGLASLGKSSDNSGWQSMRNALNYVDEFQGRLSMRLPIPLNAGETIELINTTQEALKISYGYNLSAKDYSQEGVKFLAQFKNQMSGGEKTTTPLFEESGAIHYLSTVHQLIDGRPGDRLYLEGDEMIRVDGMSYPIHLGTGTEDYYNGGWYFWGAHDNAFSGLPRFVVHNPEDGWSQANFEHALYRHHIADPIVARDGLRFGLEAGPEGDYTPLRMISLGLGYKFKDFKVIETRSELSIQRGSGEDYEVESSFDAEKNSKPIHFQAFKAQKSSHSLRVNCPTQASGLELIRTYDAKEANQRAWVLKNSQRVGQFFDFYKNESRRLAQDVLWLDVDCSKNRQVELNLDFTGFEDNWSEIDYKIKFFKSRSDLKKRNSTFIQGKAFKIFDTQSDLLAPHYVNDHGLIFEEGQWHLFGIYHQEPFNPLDEKEFVHAIANERGPYQDQRPAFSKAKQAIALKAQADLGESHIWAPHVVKEDGKFYMVYQGSGIDNDQAQMRLAVSDDLNHWSKLKLPLFKDICVSRDPFLMKHSSLLWVLYYTRCDSTQNRKSAVAFRTSLDLVHWSEPQLALVLEDWPSMFNSGHTESPSIFKRGEWYYLSVTNYPLSWDATMVYRSRTPFYFEPTPFARLKAHAAEWFEDKKSKQLFMTHAGPGQGGVWSIPVYGP